MSRLVTWIPDRLHKVPACISVWFALDPSDCWPWTPEVHAATKRRRRLGNILRLSFALNVGRNGDGTTLISSSKISGYHWTLAVIDVDCLYFPSFFFSFFLPFLPPSWDTLQVALLKTLWDGVMVDGQDWMIGGLRRVRGDSFWGFSSLLVEVNGVTSGS